MIFCGFISANFSRCFNGFEFLVTLIGALVNSDLTCLSKQCLRRELGKIWCSYGFIRLFVDFSMFFGFQQPLTVNFHREDD